MNSDTPIAEIIPDDDDQTKTDDFDQGLSGHFLGCSPSSFTGIAFRILATLSFFLSFSQPGRDGKDAQTSAPFTLYQVETQGCSAPQPRHANDLLSVVGSIPSCA